MRDARQFYLAFPIWNEIRAKLGWTQYRRIMRITSIDTHLFERLLHTQEAKAQADDSDAKRASSVLNGLGGVKDAEMALLAAYRTWRIRTPRLKRHTDTHSPFTAKRHRARCRLYDGM